LAAAQVKTSEIQFWRKAFIFCQALAGENQKAALGLNLLRELGGNDPVYFSLLDSLTSGETPIIESLKEPSPLHLAVARASKAKLPADIISSNRPAILRTIAISPNAPIELRLEAAERAEAVGSLSVDTLRQLYASVSFSDEDLASPLARAEKLRGPMSRALLYRTALDQTVATAQAEALIKALELGRSGGRYGPVVRAFMQILKSVNPGPEVSWFAPEAVRALMISGQYEAAAAWLNILRASALFDTGAAAELKSLTPILRLGNALEEKDWSPTRFEDWWSVSKEKKNARENAELLYSLFSGIGEDVPEHMWFELLEGPERETSVTPHPSFLFQMSAAANAGRLGETVLLSMLILGEGGPTGANPMVLSRIINVLFSVGLEQEARALAVEAALASGL